MRLCVSLYSREPPPPELQRIYDDALTMVSKTSHQCSKDILVSLARYWTLSLSEHQSRCCWRRPLKKCAVVFSVSRARAASCGSGRRVR